MAWYGVMLVLASRRPLNSRRISRHLEAYRAWAGLAHGVAGIGAWQNSPWLAPIDEANALFNGAALIELLTRDWPSLRGPWPTNRPRSQKAGNVAPASTSTEIIAGAWRWRMRRKRHRWWPWPDNQRK